MTAWWQQAVIYQIYPRSFQDSNGDGVGDLPGITRRLDYLAWLGVDAVWICPIYPSPMADFGYDVSNYIDIHPMFGTLADMDALIAAAHQRGIRIILDFVPNHTSDQHPWFIQSRSSRDNPRRDWYLWQDPAPDGGPPNNWISRFGGESAWEWDAATGQYYLHSFLKEQPDLNWRNPDLRAAMLDVMRFWFRRGVDGFRVDVSYRVMKDAALRDNPANPDWQPGMDPSFRLIETYTKNTPDIHQFNRWLRQVADEFPDRVLVGEMNLPIPALVQHYGTADAPEFHLPFNFRLVFAPWEAQTVRALADSYDAALPPGAWPNWVLSNHDQPRFPTRAGAEQARSGLLYLLTMRGTPTLYYGDELGMTSVPIPPDKVQDPWEILAPGLGLGRDPVRTPMPWDDSPNGGFCPAEVQPWLPLGGSPAPVALQRQDASSTLRFTQRLIALRREFPALLLGDYRPLESPPGSFVYLRQHLDQTLIVALNFTPEPLHVELPGSTDVLLSTRHDDPPSPDGDRLPLRGHEGVLLRLRP